MKRFTVTQYGSETVGHERRFVVEVPDSMEKEDLDEKVLERLAFDEWVDWETHEDLGECVRLTEQEINPTCDADEKDKLPVLQYPTTSDAN